MITIGDKVKVCWTGDDQLDWAAGLEGEVIDTRKITVPSGERPLSALCQGRRRDDILHILPAVNVHMALDRIYGDWP